MTDLHLLYIITFSFYPFFLSFSYKMYYIAAYEKEKFGFFEEFVSKQYLREIQEHSLQMERFYEENDEEDLLDPQLYDDDSETGDEYDNEYVQMDENGNDNNTQEWVFEVDNNGEYRIFEQRKERKTSIANSRKTYKINVKQNPKDFAWAMFKPAKKVKTIIIHIQVVIG